MNVKAARLLASLCTSFAAPSAFAEGTGAPPSTPAACEGRAAIFSDGKARLFVLRRGTIAEDNPLRPLSTDPLLVLDLVVGGRSATVLGPDPETLHRGPAPAALEEEHKAKIAWTAGSSALPPSFRIVSDDGALQSTFTLAECGDAPKVAATTAKGVAQGRRRNPAAGAATGSGLPAMPRGLSLPQGAVPEGGKLQ